jgi:TP901 family phage tail tape measure protein
MTVGTKFTAIDQLSKPMRKMSGNADKFGSQMRRSFSGVTSTLHTMRRIATMAFAVFGISATLAVGAVTREFLNFDESILSASSKFSDLDITTAEGQKTFERMGKTARQVGATTKFTAAEAAGGLNYLAMAGFNAEQSMVALPQTTNLAIVAQTDLARATDITTDSLGAFGLMTQDTTQLQKNLGRVNDVYARTVSRTNTNMEQLFESVKKGAPTFTAAGQDIETFTALAGSMANAGIKGAESGTALRNVMLRLAKPTGESAKVLRRLGVVTQDSNGDFRDVIDILADMEKGLQGMGTQQRSAALSTIFGARAVTGVNVLLGEGTEALRKFRDEQYLATGTSERMAAIIGQSLNNRILGLKSAAYEVGFQFMESFDNQAGTAIDTLTEKIRGFDSAPMVDKMLTAASDIKTAWENGTIPAILKGIVAFTGLRLAISVLGVLKIAIMGILTAITFVMANPIVLAIAAGIALIAGAAYLIMKNWEPIKEFFVTMWEAIVESMEPLLTAIDTVKNFLDGLGSDRKPTGWDSIPGRYTDTPKPTSAPANWNDIAGRYAPTPVSPNAGMIESTNTNNNNSTVDINFNNTPQGTTITQTKPAPGVRLNPGFRPANGSVW